MPRIVLGLVTLFHPERFLPGVDALPRREKSRQAMTAELHELKSAGRVALQYQVRDKTVVVDSGTEVRRFRNTMLAGTQILPFLAEPRVIRIPDESPRRARRKIEFRMNWPDDEGILEPDHRRVLRDSVGESQLKVRGFWINPSTGGGSTETEWANLVLGPLEGSDLVRPASLRFLFSDGLVWVEW